MDPILLQRLKDNDPTLRTLNLRGSRIGAEGLQALAHALEINTTLTTLNLRESRIGAEGIQALAHALEINTTLTTLHLSYFPPIFSDDDTLLVYDLQALAVMLSHNRTLRTLVLLECEIGSEGATVLSTALAQNTTLTTLDLGGNGIGPDGARALAAVLSHNHTLTTLDLGGNPDIGDEGARALATMLETNMALKKLSLLNNTIGLGGIRALARALKVNTVLTKLTLTRNKIGSKGMKALAHALEINTTLKVLMLFGCRCRFGPAGLQALAQALEINTTLRKLDLAANKIGDEGARVLAAVIPQNRMLTQLHLGINNIGDEGARALAAMLSENRMLTTLDLGHNHIGDEGARALAHALERNTTLTKLGLKNNHIGPEGARDLSHALEKNTTLRTLTLSLCGVDSDTTSLKALAAMLTHNHTLTTLDFEVAGHSPMSEQTLDDALQDNFSLCEVEGLWLQQDEAKANLASNKVLRLVETRQAAIEALCASEQTLSISRYDIEEKRQELEYLTLQEAHAVIQFERRIGMLKDAIQRLETAQEHMARKTSESAQKVKEDLRMLHFECVSREIGLLPTFFEALKGKFDIAIDSIVEHISQTSLLFSSSRFLMFQFAHGCYRDNGHSPVCALTEALPLLKKEDGTLLVDFERSSVRIGKMLEPAEQQRVFDSVVLTAAGRPMVPNERRALTNEARADLLRFTSMCYAKDIMTAIEHSRLAVTFFVGDRRRAPAQLTRLLTTLVPSFDVTDAEERENVHRLFDKVYQVLRALLSESPTETQIIKDLRTCYDLMTVLPTHRSEIDLVQQAEARETPTVAIGSTIT